MTTILNIILDIAVYAAFGLIVLIGAIVYLIDGAWRALRRAEERWAPWSVKNWIKQQNQTNR